MNQRRTSVRVSEGEKKYGAYFNFSYQRKFHDVFLLRFLIFIPPQGGSRRERMKWKKHGKKSHETKQMDLI